ncbi:MAG: hypothetical protein II887_00160 [Bacteroidales bacterium]|nr:hypothetical protein [Bacteroidales bacterium]
MKKLALTFAIVLGLSLCSYAQGGGLFGYGEMPEEEESVGMTWYGFYQDQEVDNTLFGLLRSSTPGLPDHGLTTNEDAPLTGGVLMLIGLGAAYALKKRSKK